MAAHPRGTGEYHEVYHKQIRQTPCYAAKDTRHKPRVPLSRVRPYAHDSRVFSGLWCAMTDEEIASTAVEGNQQKFAWLYALLGDTEISATAKTVGIGTALKLAGRKGYFKATRKAIANLCGLSLSTVNRAFVELAGNNYWGIDYKTGGANIYTLIMPDRRLEMWLASESEYQRQCRKWLWAEDEAIRSWLDAERAYKSKVEWEEESRSKAPADETERASGGSRGGSQCEQMTSPPCQIRGGGLSNPAIPLVNVDKGGLSDPAIPLVMPDQLTSENDQTHKFLERFLKEPERFSKDPRNDYPATSAPDGTPSARTSCQLCDDDGIFIDPDELPVVLLENTDNDDYEEYQVKCKHSLEGNLAEIRRIEQESNGYWGLAKTGYKEIDCHYGFTDYDLNHFDDDNDAED